MVFQVSPARASIKQNVFEFELPGSKKKWSLPKQQYLNADLRQRLGAAAARVQAIQSAGGKVEVADGLELEALQRELIEKYCPGLYAAVDDAQLQEIVAAWKEASAITMGESSASASS